ncbi:YceD family protein [Brucellaceae bacterium C25G]
MEEAVLNFPVSVQHVPHKGIEVTLKSDKRERDALAKAHGLEDVVSFSADFTIIPWKKSGIKIRGKIRAEIVQACVATLEPINNQIDEDVEVILVPEHSRLARIPLDENGEMLVSADGPDIPETFSGDKIDVGVIAEEFFDLAIDPYPRKAELADSVVVSVGDTEVDDDNGVVSPFASLANWKKKS